MAERYVPCIETNTDSAPFPCEIPLPTEAFIIPVDFRPNPTREQMMRRIGEVATLLWNSPENKNLLSCKPLSSGPASVNFRVFYSGGYNHSDSTIPHLNGWSGEESTGIYQISYDADSGQFATGFIQPRNLRYHISEAEAKKRAGTYDEEIRTLHQELWGDAET